MTETIIISAGSLIKQIACIVISNTQSVYTFVSDHCLWPVAKRDHAQPSYSQSLRTHPDGPEVRATKIRKWPRRYCGDAIGYKVGGEW